MRLAVVVVLALAILAFTRARRAASHYLPYPDDFDAPYKLEPA